MSTSMISSSSSSSTVSAIQRALASAVLQAAMCVFGEETQLPFIWSVEHMPSAARDRRFILHVVPDENCRCFIFRAPLGGTAQLLYEKKAKAKAPLRLPPTGEFSWDGKDDSLLMIIAAGHPSSGIREETLDRPSASPLRGCELINRSTGLLALDPEALGLHRDDAPQRP